MENKIKEQQLIAELNSVYFLAENGEQYWHSFKINKVKDQLTVEELGILLIYDFKKEKFELSGTTPDVIITKIKYTIQKMMARDSEFKRKVKELIN